MTVAQLCGVALGILIIKGISWWLDRRRNPHRWACPVCEHFQASSNDEGLINRIRFDHMSKFHPEEDA